MTSLEHLTAALDQFATEYASQEVGRRHLAAYIPQREQGRANFQDVVARADRGEDVTSLVLVKLLPHLNSPHNRQRGAWVHIAPAITRDVQKWFQRAGWAGQDDWPMVSLSVLDFYRRVAARPDEVGAACREFAELPWSKGIQTAFLSPLLNALFPERFCIVNSKSRKTAKAFSKRRYPLKIERYPETNGRLLELIDAAGPHLAAVSTDGTLPVDVFDAFCHWFIAIRKGDRPDAPDPGDERSDQDLGAAWFRKRLPGQSREAVERLLADAITAAHENGAAGWGVTWKRWGLRLNVGRLAAFTIRRRDLEFGVLTEEAEELLAAIPDAETTAPFAAAPEATSCIVPFAAAASHEQTIRAAIIAFIPAAAGTAARTPYARSHTAAVADYLSAQLGRDLPEPRHGDQPETRKSKDTEPPQTVAFRGPRTVFRKVDYELSTLLHYIDMGDVALPELQRPFVWTATKVRDLFDSMYRGYPVGYLLFWSNASMRRTRPIGDGQKQHTPDLLIVDGQQRLTSLFAVFRHRSILNEDYVEKRLEIAFRPRDAHFDVTDAAIRRDPEFIHSISDVLGGENTSWNVTGSFLQRLEAVRPLSVEDKNAISANIDRLLDLHKYPFTALEISSEVDEQSVADVFVRINSEGVKLKQSDFILTLLSVIWPEGRQQLDRFAHECATPHSAAHGPSPYNHLIRVGPDQQLRVAIAVGFHRARLKAVYQLLRAKEFDGTEKAGERRETDLARLRDAQTAVLDLRHWHSFLHAISAAGYRSDDMISSTTALIYSYALFLIGWRQCGVREHELQRLCARWFVANLITGRYSGSSETIMEEDLSSVKDMTTAAEFVGAIEARLDAILTNDFWNMTLPLELETSSSRSPAALAYLAAQVKLNAPTLFSDKPVAQLLDPTIRAPRPPMDRHHLFPRRYLQTSGIKNRKEINQVANFAVVEWPDNLTIGGKAPAEYAQQIKQRFSTAAWDRMMRAHALPPGWYELDYTEFLRQRRPLMAAMIRRAYDSLSASEQTAPELNASPSELQLWELLRDVERRLRTVVRASYEQRWGDRATARMKSSLGVDAMKGIEKARGRAVSTGQTGDELLDYTYLGQLVQLMIANDAWDMFKPLFRDKRELEDMARSITKVRNEAAHFRHVPEEDLVRCRVAAQDLLRTLDGLEHGELADK
jgi:hypothetical protein